MTLKRISRKDREDIKAPSVPDVFILTTKSGIRIALSRAV
jgi:hypothetical protein